MFRISLINLCQKNIKSSYNIGRQVLFLNRFNSTMSTKIGRGSCKGKRVDLGGRRIIKKKKKIKQRAAAQEKRPRTMIRKYNNKRNTGRTLKAKTTEPQQERVALCTRKLS